MPMCNFSSECTIDASKIDSNIKEQYCNNDFPSCARWQMVNQGIYPPDVLMPHENEKGQEFVSKKSFCQICGSTEVVDGYNYNLCHDCRNIKSHIQYPKWIKISFIVMLVLFTVSLVTMPKTLTGAVAWERGDQAKAEKKYTEAATEYQKVLKIADDNITLNSYLFTCYVNNGEDKKADEIFKKMAGKEVPVDVFNQVDPVVKKFQRYNYYSEELENFINNISGDQGGKDINFINALEKFIDSNPDDVMGNYLLANKLYDIEEFAKVEKVMEKLLASNSDYIDGWLLLAASKREQQKYDEALDCCNKVLENSKDCPHAFSSMGKIEIKRGNTKKGIELVSKAYYALPDDVNVGYNLVLAYNYAQMLVERDMLLEKIKANNPPEGYVESIESVISGESNW